MIVTTAFISDIYDFTTFNTGNVKICLIEMVGAEKEWREECCLQINLIYSNQSTGTTDIFILYTTHSPARSYLVLVTYIVY